MSQGGRASDVYSWIDCLYHRLVIVLMLKAVIVFSVAQVRIFQAKAPRTVSCLSGKELIYTPYGVRGTAPKV